jgi:uncharacterized protein DUF4124
MRKVLLFAGLVLFAAAPLHAETYKWVDEKGVTNYSSTPPPAKAKQAKVIEDRISIIPADPSFADASAALRAREARRAEYAHAEWLQRQRAAPTMYADYSDCYDCNDYGYGAYAYPYYPVVFTGRRLNAIHRHPGFAPVRPVHHRSTVMVRSRGGPLR